jgi:hypothetical protein
MVHKSNLHSNENLRKIYTSLMFICHFYLCLSLFRQPGGKHVKDAGRSVLFSLLVKHRNPCWDNAPNFLPRVSLAYWLECTNDCIPSYIPCIRTPILTALLPFAENTPLLLPRKAVSSLIQCTVQCVGACRAQGLCFCHACLRHPLLYNIWPTVHVSSFTALSACSYSLFC